MCALFSHSHFQVLHGEAAICVCNSSIIDGAKVTVKTLRMVIEGGIPTL